jgi:hypothetical protein
MFNEHDLYPYGHPVSAAQIMFFNCIAVHDNLSWHLIIRFRTRVGFSGAFIRRTTATRQLAHTSNVSLVPLEPELWCIEDEMQYINPNRRLRRGKYNMAQSHLNIYHPVCIKLNTNTRYAYTDRIRQPFSKCSL